MRASALAVLLFLAASCRASDDAPPPPDPSPLPPAFAPSALPIPAAPRLPVPRPALPALEQGAVIRLFVEPVLEGQRVIVRGETNLHDGTHLVLLFAEHDPFGLNYRIQGLEVRNGRFEDAPFWPWPSKWWGARLPAGVYTATAHTGDDDVPRLEVETRIEYVAGGDRRAAEAASRARASKRRLRYLELMATLPRFEAEQRAWPRPLTLECQEKGRRRVAEIEAIRMELSDVAGQYATTTAAFEACMELEKCAACDGSGDVAHCATARDLLDEARGDWVRAQRR